MEISIDRKSLVIRLDSPCEQCGGHIYEIRYKKPHLGLYCRCCGKYIKWLSKEEKKKYGIVTPEDFKLNGIGAKYTFIDDTPMEEITQHRKDYEDDLEDKLPWD